MSNLNFWKQKSLLEKIVYIFTLILALIVIVISSLSLLEIIKNKIIIILPSSILIILNGISYIKVNKKLGIFFIILGAFLLVAFNILFVLNLFF